MRARDIEDFDQLLEDAESQARTDWEMAFVSDIQAKYDYYEDDLFVSEKQLDTLMRIAHVH